MARKHEPLNFAGSLEVQSQKPLDARRKVTLIADLTEAASFPYIYKGLDVFCEENSKWYTFLGGDSTDANNWRMEGSGGGGGASLDITENYARVSQGSKQLDVWGKSADSLTIEYTDNNGNTGGATLYTSRSTYRKDEVDHMVEQRPLYQNSISGGKLTSMIIANENEKGINVAQSADGVNVSFYGNSTDTKNLVDKAYVDGGLADKADKSTTYTKTETDALIEGEHIELTQAEYDALTDEEKNNGKVYFITDGGAYVPAVDLIPYVNQAPIVVGKLDLRGDGEFRDIKRVRLWINDLKNASGIITAGWTEAGVYVRPIRIYGWFTFHDTVNTPTSWEYRIQQLPIPYSGYKMIEAPLSADTIGLKFYVDHNNKLRMVVDGKSEFHTDDFACVIVDFMETPVA